jgi:hypothetical protein
MPDPVNVGMTLVKNSPSLLRNLFNIWGDAALAGNRTLVADQRRKLAERYAVAESVIAALMEQEQEIRASATHGIRLELKEPITASWSDASIRGSLYVTVRNPWVHPATLTKLVAKLETSGYKSIFTVSTHDTDKFIAGMSGHCVDHLRKSTIRDDRLAEATLGVTPTASITWEGLKFTVETAFSPLVLVAPRNTQAPV